MNWIQGIQRAIDYVEANITEELDFDDVARQAFSSPFHFQRVFSMLCGFSLGDYIRMRRLSLAGEELSRGNAKIIEIALKYGYDTPESFPARLPGSTALRRAKLGAAERSAFSCRFLSN